MKLTLEFTPRLFTIAGAVKYTGDCKTKLYQAQRDGLLQMVKMDGATRIERTELDRFIDAKAKPKAA